MSGCKSCSGSAPEPSSRSVAKADKLEKSERSCNPRYPHVLVGQQAIYTDDEVQMIVNVLADDSDENCDSFTLKPQRILKNNGKDLLMSENFQVSQPAGDHCWRLHALL
jgi:hypothetical protein